MAMRTGRGMAAAALVAAGCTHIVNRETPAVRPGRIDPGITVVLEDSLGVIRGKRIGLLTNRSAVDRSGTSDIALLAHGVRARAAGVQLVALFSPEHGLGASEDRTNIPNARDPESGLTVISLYGTTPLAPPDSALAGLNALVIDLPDVGTRTWTYVTSMVYAMQAAARHHLPVVVLDRPNPITGVYVEGPMLDSAIAAIQPPRPYAFYSIPLRHGLTMGELASFYNDVLHIRADLHVIPVRGWRRALWFDQTHLKWERPSPGLPSLTSELLYPALVAFESSNLSVGRGTEAPFQRIGAPWLDAAKLVRLLRDQDVGGGGVRFLAESFTPDHPTDGKYAGHSIPGVRIVVTDRNGVHVGRLAASLLWAVAKLYPDSLRLDTLGFDARFGSAAARRAVLRGADPDGVIDAQLGAVVAFEQRSRRYMLYR
jgi:uncharacterized protein YbbC (DUF1343 family)